MGQRDSTFHFFGTLFFVPLLFGAYHPKIPSFSFQKVSDPSPPVPLSHAYRKPAPDKALLTGHLVFSNCPVLSHK
jgi:hypothetical protein